MVLASCEDPVSTTTESTLKEKDMIDEAVDVKEEIAESDKELPILPPIILLDFGDNNDNSTSSPSDEKSKRTINNELGYGYLKNNLFNGKYNYYFPGGKTGTTVSIEESISPFEPKTIIEPYKPITERPEGTSSTYKPDSGGQVDQPIAQPWTATFPGNQPVFGQRTKLRKVPTNDYAYQGYTSTQNSNVVSYTTQRPNYANHHDFSASPAYQNQYKGFSTTASYNSRYVGGMNGFEPATTPRPLSSDPSAFNLPRYTVENGIRYENKIIWKYPDGRIANPPPTSYVNSYTEFSTPQKTKINHQNGAYQSSFTHQNLPDISYSNMNFRGPAGFQNSNAYQGAKPSGRFPSEPISNIHSQRPAQFPTDQDNYSSRPGGNSQPQAFDFSYQNNYGLRQRGNVKGSTRNEQNRPKYSVDSPNPEYTYPTDSPLRATTPSSNLYTQSGQLSPQVIQKYTPQVQKYLSKVFKDPKTEQQYSTNSEAFIKNNYENILNYNPSISQYIRDPSSILNAQPTFIQAGDSLVPVIILRVDGARPIQPQPTPNINLKALLQQYLTQYAGNKASSQNIGYDYRNEAVDKLSPLNDLTQLTQALRRFSPNTENTPNLGNHRLADLPLKYDTPRYTQKTSYDTVESSQSNIDNLRYANKVRKPQKVKSVQIIEDPRYPSYKASS